MAGLADAINKNVEALRGIQKTLDVAYRDTLIDIGTSLVFFTPIDTGLASSNWNVGISSKVGQGNREPSNGDKGAASLLAMTAQVKTIKAGDRSVFSNTVDYIIELERGKSSQSPAGMVGPTQTRVQGFWHKNLKKHNIIK